VHLVNPAFFGVTVQTKYKMEKVIDIRAESLPWYFKLAGMLLVVLALALMTNVWWLSVILGLVGLIILTTHSGTQIDPSTKTFREYHSILSFRYGQKETYDGVENIFINAAKVSQTVHPAHTLDSATFSHVEYNAYLKLSDGRKIFLMSKRSKTKLINRLKQVMNVLKVEVVDNAV
jgi:hypothetical protein